MFLCLGSLLQKRKQTIVEKVFVLSPKKFLNFCLISKKILSDIRHGHAPGVGWCTDLYSNETVDFQDTYFKITRRTQWRIVEGFTAISFAKAYIFIHPNGLTLAGKEKKDGNKLINRC